MEENEAENVNIKIMRKLDAIEDESVKQFLKNVFVEELNYSNREKWHFASYYEKLLKKAIVKWGGENEDSKN